MDKVRTFGSWPDKKIKGDELCNDVGATADHWRKLSLTRAEREKRLMRLYCPDPSGHTVELANYLRRDRAQFNLIRQAVDTQLAQVTSQKYLPRYTVVDGSWTLGRTARKRTRVLEGQAEDLDVGARMYEAALDAYACGGPGHLVVFYDHGTQAPAVERAQLGEILFDPCLTTKGGQLRQAIRRRAVPTADLVERFEKHALMIEASGQPRPRDRDFLWLPKDDTLRETLVDEAWSAGTEDKPGRHVICVSRAVLVDEPWPYDVPVIPIYYLKRQTGYVGIGIGELGQDEQARLDRILTRADQCDEIDATLFLMAGPSHRFSGEAVPGTSVARVLRTAGGPLVDIKSFRGTGTPLHAEVERIRERFMSLLGISQLDMEAKKPAGITSAPGQRTYADLASRRQRQVSDNMRDAWMGVFKALEQANAYAQKKNGDFSLAARTTRGLQPLVSTVKWSEAHMPPEQYRLSMQLVSDVPYQVGSRVEALQEWIQSGFTRRSFGQAQVLQGPNEDFQRRETADTDYACWMVEQVLEGDLSVELDPLLIPEVAFDVFRTSYLPIKSDGAPEPILAKLRALIQASLDAIQAKSGPIPGPTDPQGTYAPPEAMQLPSIQQAGAAAPPPEAPMQ